MSDLLAAPGTRKLLHAISLAIGFLHHRQLPHGEFATYASPDQGMGDESYFDSSPFATSLILHSIGLVSDPRVEEMTAKALDFLETEMEGPGLWRYWASRNERHNVLPPDLDDTCCISFILKRNQRPVPLNRAILLANRNNEGVFHTWLIPTSTSLSQSSDSVDGAVLGYAVDPESLLLVALSGMADDIDCVVNANALLYLGEDEDTTAVVDYLVDIVLNGKEDGCSAFYPDRLSFYYMLSRAYCNGVVSLERVRVPVTDRVIRMQDDDGSFGSELLTALAVCTLLNFNMPTPAIPEAVKHILRTQKEDGSWPRTPMFLGPAPYYGSEELTTAFCIEALAKCHTSVGSSG